MEDDLDADTLLQATLLTPVYNMGALIIAFAILGVPYYNQSIMGPTTLVYLSRPLYYRLHTGGGCAPRQADLWR